MIIGVRCIWVMFLHGILRTCRIVCLAQRTVAFTVKMVNIAHVDGSIGTCVIIKIFGTIYRYAKAVNVFMFGRGAFAQGGIKL